MDTIVRGKILHVTADLCVNCHICEIVCSLSKEGVVSPALSRVRVQHVSDENVVAPTFVPLVCRHCQKPVCKSVCPVPDAMIMDSKTGAVIINESECIGCLACVDACPFGAIFVSQDGRVIKCDLCGGDPVCARYCPPTPANSSPYLPYPRASCLEYGDPDKVTSARRAAQIARYQNECEVR